jgi:hypothetical protein
MAFHCLVSLPNIKGSGHTRECFVEDNAAGEAQAQEFIKREDVAGRAVYECIVSSPKDDAPKRPWCHSRRSLSIWI